MAPEVIKGDTADCKADCWSLGIVIRELLEGEPPYMEYPPLRAMFLITSKGVPPLTAIASQELQQFLCCCLNPIPHLRPTSNELLNHQFLRKSALDNLLEVITTLPAETEHQSSTARACLSNSHVLPAGTLALKFENFKIIGEGAAGSVFSAIDTTSGKRVAVKKFFVPPVERERTLNELAVLRGLKHPNILQILDCFVEGDQIWEIFE